MANKSMEKTLNSVINDAEKDIARLQKQTDMLLKNSAHQAKVIEKEKALLERQNAQTLYSIAMANLNNKALTEKKAIYELNKLRLDTIEKENAAAVESVNRRAKAELILENKLSTVKLDNARKITDLQTLMLANNSQAGKSYIRDKITSKFLDAQLQHEQNWNELLMQQEINNDEALKQQDMFNQRRANADRTRLDYLKSVDQLMLEYSLDTASESSRLWLDALKNEKNYNATRANADKSLKEIKNVFGTKLGNNLVSSFTRLSDNFSGGIKNGFSQTFKDLGSGISGSFKNIVGNFKGNIAAFKSDIDQNGIGVGIKNAISNTFSSIFDNDIFNQLTVFEDKWGNIRRRLSTKEYNEKMSGFADQAKANSENADKNLAAEISSINKAFRENKNTIKADFEKRIDDVNKNENLSKDEKDSTIAGLLKEQSDAIKNLNKDKKDQINTAKEKSAHDKEGTDLSKKNLNSLLKTAATTPGENGVSKWDQYMKAKADLNNATDDNRADLEKAYKNALNGTGMSQAQADAAEAQQAQKESTAAGWANATAILAGIEEKLDGMVDEIAKQKSAIDTRLNGSQTNGTLSGSYWRQINFDFSAAMMSPLIDQKTLMSNLISTVDKGISRDVEQMAMLATIKDKIATTFDVYNPTVLRLIRIQDSNTTAVRLGMETTLNKMLNSMYESTEYLSDIASNVRASLSEAEALMTDQQAVEFEYQVQKWLGSMYSVGVSDSAVNSIATAIGQLASGDITGITSGGASNLLIMAANNAGMSLSDVLADGLNASQTNVLLNNMVSYMYELVQEANGNKVVQQQLAKVFGVSASDLKAITNIISNDHYKSANQKSIYNYGNNGGDIYNGLLSNLFEMANSMYSRISVGEMLQNVWNNVQYSTAAGMAANPVLYLSNKVANILDAFAGGIEFSIPTVMGNGMAAQTWKVSDIMKAASMATGFTGSLISMIASSIGNGGNAFTGTGLLKLVGVESKVSRGTSTSSSGSGTVMNASYEDTSESSKSGTKDQAESETVSAQEESSEVTNETLNESILSIYNILNDVVDGTRSLHVKVEDQPVSVSNSGGGWVWGGQ